MKARIAAAMAGIALLAVPASTLGEKDEPAPAVSRGKLGKLVAKDSAKQHPEAAAARARLTDIGRVTWQITSKPKGLHIEHASIVRCEKGWLFDYYPGPGDVKTVERKTPFKGTYRIPLADPDMCDFQVAGQIGGERGKRGRVIVKIFNKG